MEYIKITTVDDNFIDVDFNLAADKWDKLIISRKSTRSVAKLANDNGVEIIFNHGDSIQLKYEYIDNVNGINPRDNNELYLEIIKLMK